VIVDNRPRHGIVAINALSPPTTITCLLFAPTSSFTAHPFLHEQLCPIEPSDLFRSTGVKHRHSISVPTSLKVDFARPACRDGPRRAGKLNWAGETGALDFHLCRLAQEQGLDIQQSAIP